MTICEDATTALRRCPFDVDRWSPVIIRPTRPGRSQPGPARLVAASAEGDAICMVMDLDRRRNQRLIAAPDVQVVIVGGDEVHSYAIDDVEPLAGGQYDAAQKSVRGPLGVTNALVHAHRVRPQPEEEANTAVAEDRRLVVPVASPCSIRRTQAVVAWLAKRLNWQVEYLYVSTPEMLAQRDVEDFAVEVLAQSASGIDARARVIVAEDVTTALIDVCRDRLTCMETHATAYRSSAFVDSFAAAVLATSGAPVVLIGPAFDESSTLRCAGLELALAGERYEGRVLDAARHWAARLGLPTGVLHVGPSGQSGAAEVESHHRNRPEQIPMAVTAVPAVDGALAQTLADAAGASWLAIGTHARQGLHRIAEGSVAFDVAAIASCPVVAFGPVVDPSTVPKTATGSTSSVDDVQSLVSAVCAQARRNEAVDVSLTPTDFGTLDPAAVS